jgi:hypothetical protein
LPRERVRSLRERKERRRHVLGAELAERERRRRPSHVAGVDRSGERRELPGALFFVQEPSPIAVSALSSGDLSM